MKHVFTLFVIMIMFLTVSRGQTVLETFDTAVADTAFNINNEGALSSAVLTDDATDFVEGVAALKVKPVIGEYHQWGSYVHMEKKIPEGTTLNWLPYDTLSIKIKVHEAPTIPENWLFRMHIQDKLTEDSDVEEYIYENLTILDQVTDGWIELKIPLIDRDLDGTDLPNDEGFSFIPASWYAGTYNNHEIDWDKIVYWTLTFVTSGYDASANLPADSMLVSFDDAKFTSFRKIPHVFFNGKTLHTGMTQYTWGQSSLEIEDDAGATPKTNAIKWTQGDEWNNGWTGIGWNIDPAFDMASIWESDSLKFKLKAPEGTGALRVQLEDGAAKIGQVFTPTADGEWHQYTFKLSELAYQDETSGFDPSHVSVLGFMAEESAVAGLVIYIDDVWSGNPDFDVVAPEAPQGTLVSADTYQNVVTWIDVPGESGEVYTIYADYEPITDVEKPGVDVVARNVVEGTQFVNHVILAPAQDTELTLYYAMKCVDAAGNNSPIVDVGSVTNTAKGVTVIQPQPPAGFAVDGNLGEWAGVPSFRMHPDDGSAAIVTNQDVDNDADCSMDAYVAFDNDYLYVALDVEDEIIVTDTTKSSYLVDSPDLFIGFYNGQYKHHTSLKGDAEPDYHFRFASNGIIIDNISAGVWIPVSDANYVWQEKFPTGYTVEAKISLAAIAEYGDDALFVPQVGMRIPIDFSVNDADATGEREGIITYSKLNEDQSYQDVTRWSYTWIGEGFVLDNENSDEIPQEYSLEQNYPNPFNPSTKIVYNLKENARVSLKVYNMLGQEVAVLVNTQQGAGKYEVNFDGTDLASGLYIYQITTNNFVSSRKMLLIK